MSAGTGPLGRAGTRPASATRPGVDPMTGRIWVAAEIDPYNAGRIADLLRVAGEKALRQCDRLAVRGSAMRSQRAADRQALRQSELQTLARDYAAMAAAVHRAGERSRGR